MRQDSPPTFLNNAYTLALHKAGDKHCQRVSALHKNLTGENYVINECYCMTKLLILSSDTGEGHNSAAAAIEIAATSAGLQAKIRKPLEESTRFNLALASFYNVLLTHRPQWMGAYFRLINAIRPNEREFSYAKLRN